MKNLETMPTRTTVNSADNSARAARIESLRRQVAEGTYRVNANLLADALIRGLQQNKLLVA